MDANRQAIRRTLLMGSVAMVVLIGGIGGWAMGTNLSGAVIAPGALVVESNVKKVQHLSGGVVGELLVRDGDRVREGQVVLRLDDTITRSNLTVVTKALDELAARKARLVAERDGAVAIRFPAELTRRADNAEIAHIIVGEQRLFESRREARAGQQAQLRQRIAQLGEEINGLNAQLKAKGEEIVLIARELVGVRDLWKKNLVQLPRLTGLERDSARVNGEQAQLTAAIAQARGKIAEINLQIIQIEQDLISEVAKDMREIDAKQGELIERKVTAEDNLKRIDLRAPQDGVVHQMSVHTVGGVIAPGDVVMLVVPGDETLAVEARAAPQDIDQLRLGQGAVMRFSAFNQRTTPEINGTVSRISADVSTDTRTGQPFYTLRVNLPAAEVARLGGARLVPGMPVETFLSTEDRSVLSYLIKPLRDQVARAFRER
jgi:HlyD family secretion protein